MPHDSADAIDTALDNRICGFRPCVSFTLNDMAANSLTLYIQPMHIDSENQRNRNRIEIHRGSEHVSTSGVFRGIIRFHSAVTASVLVKVDVLSNFRAFRFNLRFHQANFRQTSVRLRNRNRSERDGDARHCRCPLSIRG